MIWMAQKCGQRANERDEVQSYEEEDRRRERGEELLLELVGSLVICQVQAT
jgi:hypothetical protein